MRILTPGARPLPTWSRRAGIALVVAQVLSAISALVPALPDVVVDIAMLSGVWGAMALASTAESRLYLTLADRSAPLRLVAHVVVGAFGSVALLVGGGLLSSLPDVLGFGDWCVVAGVGAALWFGGSVVGALPILVLDATVSRLVAGFRRRVQWTVLSLLVGLIVVVAGVSAGSIELANAVERSGDLSGLRVKLDDGELTPEQIAAYAAKLWAHPSWIVLATVALALLLGLPALWSAAGKIGDAVMERIHPLSLAFDEMARGQRDVRVQEEGSTELREISVRFNKMIEALDLAERMERAFGVYVSAQVLERIRAQHGDEKIPASLRDASVFFADIRGFTSMSEKLSPTDVVALLNRYFARIVPVIDHHGGYLNKFVGDAVVVVFNGPVDQDDHAERATRCALAVQATVKELNDEGAFPELKDIGAGVLQVGVGVATGPMICGNVGGDRQMEYTVIGDTVNLAARLTSQARPGDVVVSEATELELPLLMNRTPMDAVSVKGKERMVRPFRLRVEDQPA